MTCCDRHASMDICIDCYEQIEGTRHYIPTPLDEQFWTGASPMTGPLCEGCKGKRDNYEPPEPDGEAFRGGEAAAYQAEQMERARRLK
jgi:hypothetical protein